MIVLRWALSLVLAGVTTLGLFYFMQYLIATGDQEDEPLRIVRIVDATMPELEQEVIEEIDKPEVIQEVTEDIPEIEERQTNISDGPGLNIDRSVAQVNTGMQLDQAGISATDGDYLPLVAIAPQYPQRAASRGIEGWCLVSFTVDGNGNVIEDTITVVDAEPPNIFDRSSERAATRFKFQPRVKDGVGVQVPGVQYLFTYQLEGEQ